jgi:hypothetical protein
MTAGPSTKQMKTRWPVTSGHGRAGFPASIAARRPVATWNIPQRLQMLFLEEAHDV